MKKFIIALLAGLMAALAAIGLAGCGEEQTTDTVTVTYVYNMTRQVSVSVEAGGLAVSRSVDAPTGQKFEYWYESSESIPYDFTTPVEHDLTLYAKYSEAIVTLRFYADAADVAPYRTIEKGRGELLDYADLANVNIYRPNYDFAGWTNADGTPFKPGFRMESDVNVYASFTPKTFTVVYYGREGEELKREDVPALGSSVAPDAPEIANCKFVGFDAHENITEDMADENGEIAVYAHYLPLSGELETDGARFSYAVNPAQTAYNLQLLEVTGTEVELPATAAVFPSDEALPFTAIAASLFANNKQITSVTIPAGYRTIGNGAFENCTALTTVRFLGESQLETLGDRAFAGCASLSSFTLSPALRRIGAACFMNCSALGRVDGRAPALTEIASEAFVGCTALQTVTFAYMSGLQSIAYRAFYNCQSLTAIRLDASKELASIGDQAFYFALSCSHISFYTGADAALTTIGDRAFYGAGATELVFPDSVKRIGAAAFAITSKQESGATRISLPGAIEYIGDAAFTNDCYGLLAEIEVRGTGVNYYSDGGRALIRRGTNGDTFMLYACASAGDTYTTPANIATIQPYAFSHLANLRTLTISEGPKAIPVVMAYNERIVTVVQDEYIITGRASCPLERVNLPASIEKIGLTDAEADGYVTRWGDFQTTVITSFGGCDRLQEVTFAAGSNLRTIGNKAFYTSGLRKIVIPASCDDISSLAFYQTGLEKYEVDAENAKYSSDNGLLLSKDGTTLYSFPYGGAVSTEGVVTIPSTVRTIAENAFRFSEDITEIVFETDAEGNGVTRLESGSFNGFRNLTVLTLPESLEYIGENVFTGTYVVDLVIPAKVRHIGAGSFYNMPDLKTVTFEGELPEIGYSTDPSESKAFGLCAKLLACYVPADQYAAYLNGLEAKTLLKVLNCKEIGFGYTLDANGGTFKAEKEDEPDTATYSINSPLLASYPQPVKAGTNFIGWYTENGEGGDWGTRVYDFHHATEQTTLYARWSEEVVEDGRSRETAYTLPIGELFWVPEYIFGTDLVLKFTVPSTIYSDQVFGLGQFGYDRSYLYSFNIRLYRDAPLTADNMISEELRQEGAWLLDAGATFYIVITNVVSKVYTDTGAPVYKDGDRLIDHTSFALQIATARLGGGAI